MTPPPRFVVTFLLLCAACTHGRPKDSASDPISGLTALQASGTVALLGEIHGTNEIPAFVADTVAHLAGQHRVHLGLEMPSSDEPLVAAYLESGDEAALAKSPFWLRP